MSELVEFWEKPVPGRCLIAGWHQWADAGTVSSGLPRYLIDYTDAHQIGEMLMGDFYLFQIPGTHHLLRPIVKLNEGYREGLEKRANEFYLSSDRGKEFAEHFTQLRANHLLVLALQPVSLDDLWDNDLDSVDLLEEIKVSFTDEIESLNLVHAHTPFGYTRELR